MNNNILVHALVTYVASIVIGGQLNPPYLSLSLSHTHTHTHTHTHVNISTCSSHVRYCHVNVSCWWFPGHSQFSVQHWKIGIGQLGNDTTLLWYTVWSERACVNVTSMYMYVRVHVLFLESVVGEPCCFVFFLKSQSYHIISYSWPLKRKQLECLFRHAYAVHVHYLYYMQVWQ